MLGLIKNPYVLLVICFVVAIILRLVFKIDYMNCFKIINKHLNIFTNTKTNKILVIPLFIYMILPLFIAISINQIKVIDEDMINNITIILSILTSMLFTLLVMVIDMKNKTELRINKEHISSIFAVRTVIKETYYSIMFEILVSISLLVLCFVYMFTQITYYIVSLLVYYLLFLLIFNLFIVLKRIFTLIDVELSN